MRNWYTPQEQKTPAEREAVRAYWRAVKASKPKPPKVGMTLPEIAKELGVSSDTVARDLKSALGKLAALKQIGTIEQFTDKPLIGCASVECRQDWIRIYGETA